MSISIISPTNNSTVKLGTPITFKGQTSSNIVKVELFAEQFSLGSDTVESGEWLISYPAFNKSGIRQIKVIGLDSSNNQVDSYQIALIVINPIAGREPGLDVSNHDETINWRKVKNAGFSFAYAKATEGITFRDKFFPDNWRHIQSVGMIRGAYHFFRPRFDAKEQARNFLDYVASVDPIQPGDLPPALDLEHFPDHILKEWESLTLKERVKVVRTWIDVVESELNRKTMIYTSFGFWDTFMPGVKDFADHPLWVANFTSASKPKLPNEWLTWKIWQFSEREDISGIPAADEDGDRFNGSLADLLAFIPTTIIP
jgi:GH25 family lysozyme M1 (1,4-beta-N-acetylmuramidase)